MQSDAEGPVNIGCPQYVTASELVATVINVSGKGLHVKHVDGPVGVYSRNLAMRASIRWGGGLRFFSNRAFHTRTRGLKSRLKPGRRMSARVELGVSSASLNRVVMSAEIFAE